MRSTRHGAAWGRVRPGRVACAVLASLLLHGAVFTAWHGQRPHGAPALPVPRQAMEVLWIAAAPAATAPPAPQPVARPSALLQAQAAAKTPVASLRPSRPPPPGPAAAAPPEAALPAAPGPRADAVADAMTAAAPPPQRAASDSAVPDRPVQWSAEAVGRADRQERAWQRRHGATPAAQLAAGAGSAGTPSPGGPLAPREWRGGDGARVAQGQGLGGSTYCVRVPSANRLPELGAAPRVAPVTNCP
ncbi:hypothetical protein [Acidovorax sp. M2(2025)]|uniref:hypothetical protein n=1 Tax=Acidovorax sp. M2(2025) TaxID=3411355 RepID=UPI003BF501A3